ncbi:DNRLRE domain-containing protein [Candidatus Uhrbacteria bacterium]|nr:DNRLRE domain-containing protein [Candidatus Uhrbacteria bacterium]
MKTGFTLIEIVLTVALVAIIATSTAVLSLTLLRTNDLDNAVTSVVSALYRAQTLSRAGDHDSAWGVNIQPGIMTLFSGSAFESRNQSLDQTSDIPTTISASGITELVFAKTTGLPSSAGVIVLTHNIVGDRRLFINSIGTIDEVASGPTISFGATRDATLIQSSPTTNDGAGVSLQEYPRNTGYNKRLVVGFTLSTIPPSAIITSAVLKLKETQTYGATRVVAVHALTQSWSETNATWNTLSNEFTPTASATTNVSWTRTLKWDQWDVTGDVQAFVNGSRPNHGWLIKDANEDTSEAYWYFSSREGTDPPVLEITYTL